MRKKRVKFFNEFSKIGNVYFNYQKTVAYYQAVLGLAYRVLFFKEWLASTNAANVVTTNHNEKQTVNQTEKNSTSESRMKWNYGQTSTLIHFWKNNIDNIESLYLK